jgi:nicotinate (nicotinamide) nucleotide adenylyltransferase
MSQQKQKVILFGGSFDPITNSHVAFARKVQETLGISNLWLVVDPFPENRYPRASSQHRFRMAEIVADKNGWMASKMEILDRETKETPYSSLDTIRKFKSIHPDTEFYFVMGTDAFADFKSWPNAKDLASEATIVVVNRNGYLVNWSDVSRHGGIAIKEDPMFNMELDLNPPSYLRQYMSENELYGMTKPAPKPEPAPEQPKPVPQQVQQQQPKPQQNNQPRPQQQGNNQQNNNWRKHKHRGNNRPNNGQPQQQNLNKKAEGNK